MKNEVCKIHIPDELVASVNTDGSLVTVEERNPVFQDGDVVWIQTRYNGNVISIFSNWDNKDIITHFNLFLHNNFYCCKEFLFLNESITKIRLASEDEKAKLFDRIKREGYQWNVNTKTIEKKYSPKEGDIIFIETTTESKVISIFKEIKENKFYNHCELYLRNNRFYKSGFIGYTFSINKIRLATFEEQARLFKEIAKNSLFWNPNTKTLNPLYQPKDGDIIYIKEHDESEWISIFDKLNNDTITTYCDLAFRGDNLFPDRGVLMNMREVKERRLATENEKNLLFNALSKESFVWDSENKVLNKKFELKDGDIITDEDGNIIIFNRLDNLKVKYYCALFVSDNYLSINDNVETSLSYFGFIPDFRFRLSTAEEKQHLFDMLKLKKSLTWNPNTKSLDKLYLPQDGDIIYVDKGSYRDTSIAIFSHTYNGFMGEYHKAYCCIDADTNEFYNHDRINFDVERPIRLATEEEKRRLFNVIKENKLSWNVETKELEPLVELINANKGDYVFIKTKLYSYVAIFDYKALNRIDMFGYYNLTEGYRYFNNSFVYIREILEMRLATNSEIEEFNKQSISQGLMWNPHLKKFLSIPKHGDLCIFYDDIDDDYIIVSIFDKVDDEESFISSDDRLWNYCIPYEEKLYKQLIGFK